MTVDAASLRSLDAYRQCEVPGCWYQVHEPYRRCRDHGGPRSNPEYAQTDDGEVFDTRGFPAMESE